MATYFVLTGNDYLGNAASDTNDGLDPAGFGLSGATFTNATKTLTLTNAFTGYTWQSGDVVYISGGTGVTTGLYVIASKTDNSNIVLVADIGGTNPTDVSSASGPWTTVQKGADSASSAGDTVRICNDGTHAPTTQIDWDTNSGSGGSPISFVAYDSRGASRSTATIQATASWTGSFLANVTVDYLIFRDITFDANALADHAIKLTSAAQHNFLVGCRFTGATSHGAEFEGSNLSFVGCQFDNNSARGIFCLNASFCSLVSCRVHDNSQLGIWAQSSDAMAFVNTIFYDNGGIGARVDLSAFDSPKFINCLSYGNGGSGFDVNSSGMPGVLFLNCASINNTGYGFNLNSGAGVLVENCHTDSNSSGATNLSAGLPGENNQTGSVTFTSVTDGSEDFTPDNGGPLDSNGLAAMTNIDLDIGAAKAADPAGGGSGNSHLINGGLIG